MATFFTETDLRPEAGNLDLNALVEMARRKREYRDSLRQREMDARANVGRRRQELIEQGRMGPQPLANRDAAREAVLERFKFPQRQQIAELGDPVAVQEVPGIGRRVDYDGGRVMMGKYGSGSAVQRKEPDPNRTIEGKPAAQWFAEKAGEQGVSNRYATAVPTGKTDEYGSPTYSGRKIVDKAMNKKKA